MAITVSEALSQVYRLEAEEKARKSQINKSISTIETYIKSLNEDSVEKFKKYGIDITPLVSINFETLKNDLDAQKEFANVVNSIIDETIKFVEEYASNVRS